MNKQKSIVLLIGIFFIFTILVSTHISADDNADTIFEDELDQFQTYRGGSNNQAAIGGPSGVFAQEFKPTLNTVTRIELLLVRDGFPEGNATISIRSDLNDNDLVTSHFAADLISPQGQWIEFDFPDIHIPPEYPLYIVWHAQPEYWDDFNLLLCACNYEPDLYIRGQHWIKLPYGNYEWMVIDPDMDQCFKTYGYNRDNTPPEKPLISGPNEGLVDQEIQFNITTTDNESDDVYYYIDWGDGSDTGWIGPYSSGHQVKMSHIWESKDIFQIQVKAKDIFFEESEASIHEISLPKSKSIQNPFLEWIFDWWFALCQRLNITMIE